MEKVSFFTQNTFKEVDEQTYNTDGILSDILDLERGKNNQILSAKTTFFFYISDVELVKGKEIVERFALLNQEDLDNLVQNGLSKKTEQKTN